MSAAGLDRVGLDLGFTDATALIYKSRSGLLSALLGWVVWQRALHCGEAAIRHFSSLCALD